MKLDIKFREVTEKLDFKFSETSERLDLKFGEITTVTEYVGGTPYEGEYEVTPKLVEQTLLTKNKLMREDMVIKTIPITTVGNNSGGNTVIIGV